MSLSRDHALRRREGLPSNSLAMMQPPQAEPPDMKCPAGRCKQSFAWHDFAGMDEHVALTHPRSQHAVSARQRTLDRKYLDPVSETLARG